MKQKINEELKNGFILVAFGILLFISLEHIDIILQIFKRVFRIFSPFLLGLIIAFILNVPMNLIEKRLEKNKRWTIKNEKVKRGFSLTVSVLMVSLILFFVIALIIPDLGKTISSFIDQIPTVISEMETKVHDLSENHPTMKEWTDKINLNPDGMKTQLEGWMKEAGSGILTTSLNFVVSFISSVTNIVIAIIFAFYVLAEKEKLAGQFKILLASFMKEKHVKRFFEIMELSSKTFSKFISGQCLDACILGILCFLGMTLFRFPYALSISVLVALTALIPVFGAFIAMIIGALLISMTSFSSAFWFIVFFLCLQQIEGNLIYPRVVGNSVGLPAIWTMMAVTVGGSCFGILGMLVSVPLSSILYALMKDYVKKKNETKKEASC